MSMTESQTLVLQRMLHPDIYLSPLKFAMFAYPWGQGDLKSFSGPRKWQREVMLDVEHYLRDAIKAREDDPDNLPDFFRCAIASGRGPGKSALVGMLDRVEQSTMRQMEDNVLERDATLLSQPFVLLIAPVVWLHDANISRCVHFGNTHFSDHVLAEPQSLG